ncbi:Glutathione S-transferase domain containing protein [Pseudohyphozyma bogoriensis]|nr:Glutathione S-transferase domain containing protein [Pseudohyphozyma bogoriensis]
MAKIIMYDLVPSPGGTYFSPNTWKARLSLLQKLGSGGFEVVDVSYEDTRVGGKLSKLVGGQRKALVPMVHLEDGTIVEGSWDIAEWLDKTYPDAPSVFLPSSKTPVDPTSPEMKLAKTYAQLVTSGYGDSDSMWTTWWELSCAGLADLHTDPEVNAYFKSDEKQGGKGEFARICALEREPLIVRAKASLTPLSAATSSSPFLAGDAPGFVDYIVYGRYIMVRSADAKVAKEVLFDETESGKKVAAWIVRIEKWFGDAEEMKEGLRRLPAMP